MKTKGRPKLRLRVGQNQIEEINKIYKKTNDARQREKLHVLKLSLSGQHTYEQIAQKTDRSRSTIQEWISKYRKGGLETLLAKPKNRGRKARLKSEDQAEFKKKLQQGTFRTARQANDWLNKECGVSISHKTTYYWLGKLGAKLKVPRQSHIKKNEQA